MISVLLYFRRQLVSELTEQMETEKKNILSILNEPFRTTKQDAGEDYRLIWEPVLISRRLILIASTTFLMSPIQKLYPAFSFLIIFTVHDYLVKPYVQKKLNFAQIVSMQLLVVLTFINTFWAYSNEIDLKDDTGESISFESGKVIVTLVFRRKSAKFYN